MTKSDPRQTLQPFDARAGFEGSTLQVGLDIQWKRLEAYRQRQSLGGAPSQARTEVTGAALFGRRLRKG
jgi:hypothetical protein